MSAAKHTLGPLRSIHVRPWNDLGGKVVREVLAPDGRTIALIANSSNAASDSELFAAAPEMLAELEWVLMALTLTSGERERICTIVDKATGSANHG